MEMAPDLDACRRGDRLALEAVFREQAPAIGALLARLVGASADLEDLRQNTFVAAIRAFPRFRGDASVKTWLARIAINVVHEYLRNPERRRHTPLELLDAGDEAALGAPPDRIAAGRRAMARFYRHLDALRPKKRICFVLHVIEGRSFEEVAALVGVPRFTVRSRVAFARRELLAAAQEDPVLRELSGTAGKNGGTR